MTQDQNTQLQDNNHNFTPFSQTENSSSTQYNLSIQKDIEFPLLPPTNPNNLIFPPFSKPNNYSPAKRALISTSSSSVNNDQLKYNPTSPNDSEISSDCESTSSQITRKKHRTQ